MERKEAIKKMRKLIGQDLHSLTNEHQITVLSSKGTINKGWAGHVIERFLGLPINSAQSPNFGSWELKTIPLKRLKTGKLTFKETMAITMIDPINVCQTEFADSHLLSKLRKMVVVIRTVGGNYNDPSYVLDIVEFNLDDKELYTVIESDYNLVRETIRDPNKGFDCLTGKMGTYIQPRTKGQGNGSTSRAFYARKEFLTRFINLEKLNHCTT